MNLVVLCITPDHDPLLVLLAVAVCVFGCYAAIVLARDAAAAPSPVDRLAWLGAAVLAASSAVWSTHFIAMMAYRPELPASYLAAPTALSFVVCASVVGFGFWFVVARPFPAGPGRARCAAGGASIGLGVSAMHFTGMAGYAVAGTLAYDAGLVALSIAAGVALSIGAVVSAFGGAPRQGLVGPTLLLVLAVCADHFIAMSAVTVAFDPTAAGPLSADNTGLVSVLVAAGSVCVVAATLCARRLRVLAARAAEQQRLHDVADLALEGLLICEGERVIGLNRSMVRLMPGGRAAAEGRPIEALFPGRTVADIFERSEVEASLQPGGADAAPIPVCLVKRRITIANRNYTVIAVRDRRERLRLEAELRRLAETDQLTGLANRPRFRVELTDRSASFEAGSRRFALVLLGLDRFKSVNDTFGHEVGDALLVRVAARIKAVLTHAAPVARLGGDEFAIVVDDGDDAPGVMRLADDLIAAIARPFLIDGRAFDLSASAGVAFAPQDGATPGLLARHADLALHHAKNAGRGVARTFTHDMADRARDRRALETALRRAVAEEQFEVHFQPQVDLASAAYDGAEALVRWRHPTRGLVLPNEFIALAEETGMINAIGRWVLRAACVAAASWPEPMRVAVNFSPVQFRDPALAQSIVDVLDATGLAPSRLEVEITENVLIEDAEQTFATLAELRAIGVRIALDDFGTGFSSLGYLRRFPFDKIKIDQSFVRLTPADRGSSAIVRAILTLGASLGVATAAEGVETEAQRRFVAAEGCTQAQGFLIGQATPADLLPDAFNPIRRPLAATAA